MYDSHKRNTTKLVQLHTCAAVNRWRWWLHLIILNTCNIQVLFPDVKAEIFLKQISDTNAKVKWKYRDRNWEQIQLYCNCNTHSSPNDRSHLQLLEGIVTKKYQNINQMSLRFSFEMCSHTPPPNANALFVFVHVVGKNVSLLLSVRPAVSLSVRLRFSTELSFCVCSEGVSCSLNLIFDVSYILSEVFFKYCLRA